MTTLLLDTCIWSYIADRQSGGEILNRSRQAGVQIVVAPSSVFEVLRNSNKEVRDRQIELITRQCWTRLMPEAYLQSQDLRRAMRRLRPNWLTKRPAGKSYQFLKRDWSRTDGFWHRARTAPDSEAAIISHLERSEVDESQRGYATARRLALKQDVRWDKFDITDYWHLHPDYPIHWESGDGYRVTTAKNPTKPDSAELTAAWQYESFVIWTRWLRAEQRGACWEWMSPWFSRRWPPKPHKWVEFWLMVDARRLPREVLLWVVRMYQTLRKTTSSAPFDNQLASYLLDVDHFVTADRVFAAILEKSRGALPVLVPHLHVIPSGSDGVGALIELMAELDR